MRFLVDANVLSEATKPEPDPVVVEWLRRHERSLVVDPVILGEVRFGILLLSRAPGAQTWSAGLTTGSLDSSAFPSTPRSDYAGLSSLPT